MEKTDSTLDSAIIEEIRRLNENMRIMNERFNILIKQGAHSVVETFVRPQDSIYNEKGRIKNIKEMVIKELKCSTIPLTSDALAKRLYEPHPDISFDKFKRRVIVTVSALHKEPDAEVVPASTYRNTKEKHWTVHDSSIPPNMETPIELLYNESRKELMR